MNERKFASEQELREWLGPNVTLKAGGFACGPRGGVMQVYEQPGGERVTCYFFRDGTASAMEPDEETSP